MLVSFPAGKRISIHSLRMEGDDICIVSKAMLYIFQSTPSAWRETCYTDYPAAIRKISIHSLRMEGDMTAPCKNCPERDFNPLPPHGGRPNPDAGYIGEYAISIHSLRMEGDAGFFQCQTAISSFQSTPSAWRETGLRI